MVEEKCSVCHSLTPLQDTSSSQSALSPKTFPFSSLARGFDGVTGGNIPVAQAVVADITPPKERAKNFGLIGAAFGLGFIIGPYIGGKLSDPSVVSWFNAATPSWFAALLSAANIVLVIALLPETLARVQTELKIDYNVINTPI